MMKLRLTRMTVVAVLVLLFGGCDKCGHSIKLISPSLPKACGDNADPGRG